MNICQGLIDGSRLFPEKTAIVFEGKQISYNQLETYTAHAAAVLKQRGITPGDRVGLMLGNLPAFPVWYFGILRLGAVAVSINTRLTAEEAGYIADDCSAKAVVVLQGMETDFKSSEVISVSEDGLVFEGNPLTNESKLERFEYVDMMPDDPGIILYTSGTTGFPKGATLSHKNVRSTVHSFNHLCTMGPDDRLLLMVPLFHCYGQNAILNSGLNVGATIILQRVFDLKESIQLIKQEAVTKLFGVPTTFHLMHDACSADDIKSIKYCFSAAATLAPQLGEAWQTKFNMPIYEGYGLTETAPFASYNHRLKHVPGSIGVPVDLVEMKVIDPETGETCPIGTPGEIVVSGPNVMLGYWNRPEESAEAVRDGWFYSGDVGRMDENGYFYIVDRIKDMIAIGGMKVFPSEVERVLLDAPGVDDCAVVGLPEPTLGEEVVVFVVAKDESHKDPEALRSFALQNLGQYKVPTKVIYIDELPRNPAGKVLKTELRKYKADDHTRLADVAEVPQLLKRVTEAHPSSRDRILTDFLQQTIQQLTASPEPPAIELALLETGMDSLMMVTLASTIQAELGSQLDLPATLVFDYPRIKDLSVYLLGALGLSERAVSPPNSVATEAAAEKSIDEMSEDEALEALRKELDS